MALHAVIFAASSTLANWRTLICVIALAPLFYYLAAIVACRRFFARERRKIPGSFTTPVSVLKPVRGVDFASYENFRSFCLQDYPEYEILFCVNDLHDTAVPFIRRLIAEFPDHDIRLFSNAPQLGTNRKVANLALLSQEAKHDLLVQSDGDVRVGRNYLREIAAPFADSDTGVVSCFYRGVVQPNLWAKVEALGVATDFSAGVAVAEWLEGITFALGASVATTKTWLDKIGGYEVLARVLADDYEIGNRIAKAGGRVLLSREIVETMYPAMNFRAFWEHQTRWARTVRLCRPASYIVLLATHGLPWALVAALASGSAAGAVFFLGAYLAARLAMAYTVGVWGLDDVTARERLWLVPFRDAVHFAVWVASFFSNTVVWGGMRFHLNKSGEMLPAGAVSAAKRGENRASAG